MREMGDLKKGWRRLPREFLAFVCCVALLIVLILASGFLPYLERPATLGDKLIHFVQFVDQRLFLVPVSEHPWAALLISILALYFLGGFGWLTGRFKHDEARFRALVWGPIAAAEVGAALFCCALWKGWTEDKVPGAPYHLWSWRILCVLVAVVGCNGFTWVSALRRGPKTLPELLEQGQYHDADDLSGAATIQDLMNDPSPLLLKFEDCAWPNRGNSEVQRLLRGRLIIGRFYDGHTRTNLWVCPEIHKMQQTLVVAPSGAGKTHSIALPWSVELPRQGHSPFVVDVKGNMTKKLLALWGQRPMNLLSFNPLDPENSLKWNIFREIDQSEPDAFRLGAKLITQAIFGEISHGDNQFWDRTEQGFIASSLEILLKSNPNASPPDLARMFRTKEALAAQIAQLRALMAEYPDRFTPKDRDRFEYNESRLQLLLEDGRQKRFGFNELSQGVKIKLEPFENGHIEQVTTNGTFRLGQLAASPSCMVFAAPLSMGDDAATLAAIAFRLLQLLMHGRYSSEDHPRKIFFILDEFTKLRASTHESEVFLSTSREAGCVSVVILQEVSQLDEHARDALLGDLRDCYILHGASRRTAEWFEASFGKRRHLRSSLSEQRNTSEKRSSDGISLSATEEHVPVLAAREIRKTGGLRHGAWVTYRNYADQKPILVDLQRPKSPGAK